MDVLALCFYGGFVVSSRSPHGFSLLTVSVSKLNTAEVHNINTELAERKLGGFGRATTKSRTVSASKEANRSLPAAPVVPPTSN